MSGVALTEAGGLATERVAAIDADRAHLSEIGDGDHGVNMSKGFARAGLASRLGERSCGGIDVGAASCCLILRAIATGATKRL
jgi:dihydroxyacetone kinase